MYDKDAFYHGTNERGTPRLSALIADHGMEGYGRYWVLVEMLAGELDFKVPYKDWLMRSLAREWTCTTSGAEHFVRSMANEYGLFKLTEDYIQMNW